MQPYQQRVIDEKAELDIKIDKLRVFMIHGEWGGLPVNEKNLLDLQFSVMVTYSHILELRIKSFNAP